MTTDAQRLLARLPRRPDARAFLDDFGNVAYALRRDLTHLDADALHDRLMAWTQRTLAHQCPRAHATVSFHHARPADDSEPEADIEERWRDVEAVLTLEAPGPLTDREGETFLSLVPEFLALVDRAGRPVAWRDVEAGAAE